MKLNEILALAKQGYKPSDIKELIALAEDEGESTPETKGEPEAPAEEPAEESEQENEPDKPQDKVEEPKLDYKKMYEEQQKQIEKLQQTLLHQDHSGKDEKPDVNKILDSLFE